MLCLQGYNLTICYWPGKEMVIPDTLSHFSPWPGPNLPLDIAIHHASITPTHQQAFVNDPEMWALADLIITGWSEDIKEVPCPLCPYWQHRETLTIEDSMVLQDEALVIPPAERERVLHQLHQFHQGIMKSQLLTHGSFFRSGINKATKEVVCQCETYTWFQSQNAEVPLTPTPTPSCPWQMCATDIFMLEGVDHLVVGDFYLKIIFIWHIPPSQSNANKVVSLLKEIFAEHGIPKVLCSNNGPQCASAQFADFCISWGITHKTSSLHYLQSNGFAEACIKSIKHALQWAKYNGADPQLALLGLWATPIDTKLQSPAELLYQHRLRNNHSGQDAQQQPIIHMHPWADQHMLWSCQITGWQMQQNTCTTICWSTSCNVWHPPKGLGSCYCDIMHPTTEQLSSTHQQWLHIPLHVRHLLECSVKAVNTVPSGTTATLQALTRPLLLSGTNLHHHNLHSACSPHPLHLQHWQPRWARV